MSGSFPEFHVLHHGINVSSYVIVVPGITCQEPSDWRLGPKGAWLNALSAAGACKSHFLLYDHKVCTEQSVSWLDLVNSGKDLVNSLIRLQNGILQHPIVFICHSTGGIIVKHALWHARQQDNYRRLEQLTAGIIFLGTPHSRLRDEPRWKQVALTLKSGTKNPSRCTPSSEDLATLAKVSTQFEEINTAFAILSIYEILGTKINESRLRRPKAVVLVGPDFSLRYAKRIDRVELEVDYPGLCLCQFDEHCEAYRKMSSFIRSVLRDAESKRAFDLREYFETNLTTSPINIVRRPSKTQSSNILEVALPSRFRMTDMSPKPESALSRRCPQLPCHDFKSQIRNLRFFGRSDVLEQLTSTLLPNNLSSSHRQGPRTFALCGLGGVGKTEIAIEFMFLHQDKFDAIFWLQADSLPKLAEEFGQIAVALGLEAVEDAFDQDVSRNLAKNWFTNPTKSEDQGSSSCVVPATWLIIFDNVENPDILKDFWPSSGNGSILITSRDPFAKNQSFAAAASGRDIQPFDFDGAARFLIKLTSQGEEDDDQLHQDATEIANRLGGLPLAITQMAGIINRRALSLKEFLEQLHQGKFEEFHSLQLGPQMRGYEFSLASVWALEQLQAGPSALLDVISLLDPGPIDEEILRLGGGKIELDGYPRNTDEYLDARSALVHSSLVTKNSKSSVLLVHRLTQEVARFRMKGHRFQSVFEAAVGLISEIWRSEPLHKRYETTRWREHEAVLPHVWRLKNLYKKDNFLASIAFARLLNNVAWYYHERGKSEDHALFAPLAQAICESHDCESREVRLLLAAIRYCRGSEASQSNQPTLCLQQFTALHELRERFCKESGKRDDDLASAYNELGVAYMMNKMYVKGKLAFETSIEIYRGLENFSRAMTAFPSANLGLSYWLQGQHDKAEQILLDALHDREQEFGEMDKESLKTGRILQALGNVYETQGKLEESFEFHMRAFAQFQSTVGHSHHRTADVCHKLAGHYMRMGDLVAAKTRLKQALRIYNGRPQLKQEKARTSFKMGKLLLMLGNENETEYFHEAFRIYKELKPEDARDYTELTESDFDALVSFWT